MAACRVCYFKRDSCCCPADVPAVENDKEPEELVDEGGHGDRGVAGNVALQEDFLTVCDCASKAAWMNSARV